MKIKAVHGLPRSISRSLLSPLSQGIRHGGFINLFAGVLVFGLIVVITSTLIIKKRNKMDRAEIATYVVIIAWGSLCWGILLSKCAK